MPELVRFEGMVIVMLYNDNRHHNKPHVHAYYGEYTAALGLDGELLAGSLPKKQLKQARTWMKEHEAGLKQAWFLAVRGESFDEVEW